MSIEGIITELTAQQISDLMIERALGLTISLFLTGIGIGLGTKARNEIAKIIGLILTLIGLIGDVVFSLGLLDLIPLLTQIK